LKITIELLNICQQIVSNILSLECQVQLEHNATIFHWSGNTAKEKINFKQF
jgi:hypothetical protein